MTTARDRPPEEAPEDTSFARGLRVFLTIADRGLVRADELATLLDTPLSTVYRYLRTLTEFGFVDRRDGAYQLGPRLLVGGGSTVSTEQLIRRADPILAMLAAESGETAVLFRRVGLASVCLHQQPSRHPLRVVPETGSSAPLGVGALGRVLLAYRAAGHPGRRAQMAMLPRMKPRKFYDLVIEVAIVRPGPIQGGMVHPYLRRRNGEEAPKMPHPSLRTILDRTLGVPLFQEQVMQIAIVGAGYTAGEADELRRDMAAWKRSAKLLRHEDKLVQGFVARGISRDFADKLFSQIKGFGEYGFPESHASSFALLVYASSWIKVHHPLEFACALINSQPMGFYSASSLVRDAQKHGVNVLPPDVSMSHWDCTIEP